MAEGMSMLDYGIITAVIVVGLFIMYRALKEPLDLLFGLIKRGIIGIINLIRGGSSAVSGGYETITYG